MATAGELIKGSLRLLGVLAEGEEPSAASYADAVMALNQMLESWSTERLSVYGTKEVVYTWPAGQASQTIGINGNFGENPCPLRIDESTYYIVDGLSYQFSFVNQDQYNSIPDKTVQSTLPQVMWTNMILILDTNIEMTIYPVPSQALEMHIVYVQALTQVANENTTLYVPAGYLRAFRYSLACELAPEFGVEPSPTVKRIAAAAKRDIRRINNPGDVMSMPAALVAKPYGYNIYTGGWW